LGLDLGDARLLDTDQRAQLSLRQAAALPQGAKVWFQLIRKAKGEAHGDSIQ
jgi:hypothetical protein